MPVTEVDHNGLTLGTGNSQLAGSTIRQRTRTSVRVRRDRYGRWGARTAR